MCAIIIGSNKRALDRCARSFPFPERPAMSNPSRTSTSPEYAQAQPLHAQAPFPAQSAQMPQAQPQAQALQPPARRVYPWQKLDGTMLKWIAIVIMLIDHTAITLVYPEYLAQRGTAGALDVWQVYHVMRCIGRLAFPLFCFALVEGFTHTHSRPKYVLRLFLFALASEIPFDLALQDGNISFLAQTNVMYTLLIAFIALWAGDSIGKAEGDRMPGWATDVITIVMLLGGGLAAEYLDTDYHAFGVFLVGGLYLTRRYRWAQVLVGAALLAWYCLDHGSWQEMWGLAGLALILFYNGKRGRGMKYFFYIFYPGHLLLLYVLHLLIFG